MKNGYTLIEILILVIITAVIIVIFSILIRSAMNGDTTTWGINGYTETRCIDGYKFVIGSDHQPRQIMDSFGKGVPCQ